MSRLGEETVAEQAVEVVALNAHLFGARVRYLAAAVLRQLALDRTCAWLAL